MPPRHPHPTARARSPWLLVGPLCALWLASGCKDDESSPAADSTTGDEPDDTSTSDEPDDTSTSNVDESSSTGEGATTGDPIVEWVFDDIIGVPNLDDDDEETRADWMQLVFEGDDDLLTIAVPALPEGHSVVTKITGDLDFVRVWHGSDIVAGDFDQEVIEESDFTPDAEGSTLSVVFGDYNALATLTLVHVDADGNEIESDDIVLRSSPMVLNHHLQPSEHTWVVAVNAGFGSNADMVADYAAALGDAFTPVQGGPYGNDVWIQDEIEFATALGSSGQRLDVVIDSIRDRGLDPFAEDQLVKPNFIAQTWGDPFQATSWDSFGNLEVTPPITVDGVEYPFGRIYYGRLNGLGMHADMAAQLARQEIQAPVEMDTLWLCVGHVDEFQTFVPDASSPKGFKLLFSDVPSALALLADLPRDMAITRYGEDHAYATVGEILDDTALVDLNNDLQTDELDPLLAQFKTEFGLTDEDIVLVPSLFENISGCGGVAALIPGMVNLIVADGGGETHLFIPDPYFRTDIDDESTDPVITAFEASLPDGLTTHYVDNWDVYHLGLGEVHCGTNVTRTPTEDWWTAGLHLLEGGE